MKKHYESPELALYKLNFEDMLSTLNDSQPNNPIEIGDPGEDQ